MSTYVRKPPKKLDPNEVARRKAVREIRLILDSDWADEQPTPAVAAFTLAADVMVEQMSQTPDDLLPDVEALIKRLIAAYRDRR